MADAQHVDKSQLGPDQMIARRLREHREAHGLSQGALAKLIGYPQSYISKVENGKQRPGDGLSEALDAHFGTHGEFVALLEMARALLIEPGAREVVAKELVSVRLRTFASGVIPGLLQTEDYARSQFRKGRPRDTEDQIEERVAARLNRHVKLFGRDDPPFYRAVIDEAALARPAHSKKVMADQLRALLPYQNHPRIRVHVLPFTAYDHGMQGGSLNLLDLEAGGTVALVESFRTGQPVESPREVVEYEELFEAVQHEALPVHESGDLIRRYIEDYDDAADDYPPVA
jgi:transcriptional regulator with XRE-family HTH domain